MENQVSEQDWKTQNKKAALIDLGLEYTRESLAMKKAPNGTFPLLILSEVLF